MFQSSLSTERLLNICYKALWIISACWLPPLAQKSELFPGHLLGRNPKVKIVTSTPWLKPQGKDFDGIGFWDPPCSNPCRRLWVFVLVLRGVTGYANPIWLVYRSCGIFCHARKWIPWINKARYNGIQVSITWLQLSFWVFFSHPLQHPWICASWQPRDVVDLFQFSTDQVKIATLVKSSEKTQNQFVKQQERGMV